MARPSSIKVVWHTPLPCRQGGGDCRAAAWPIYLCPVASQRPMPHTRRLATCHPCPCTAAPHRSRKVQSVGQHVANKHACRRPASLQREEPPGRHTAACGGSRHAALRPLRGQKQQSAPPYALRLPRHNRGCGRSLCAVAVAAGQAQLGLNHRGLEHPNVGQRAVLLVKVQTIPNHKLVGALRVGYTGWGWGWAQGMAGRGRAGMRHGTI